MLIQDAQLRDAFVFANIPYYLFKHFSSREQVKQLAAQHSGKELAAELDKVYASFEKNPDDLDHIVTIYALIVAAGLKEASESDAFFHAVNKTHGDLKWLDKLQEVAQKQRPSKAPYHDQTFELGTSQVVPTQKGTKQPTMSVISESNVISGKKSGMKLKLA